MTAIILMPLGFLAGIGLTNFLRIREDRIAKEKIDGKK